MGHGTTPTHPRELPPCDLVMKGGVTSGVVYPSAVMELSARYRFENVGGTSAGAIAAAGAAAAEFARQRSGAMALSGLDESVRDFERPGFFFELFPPAPPARPLFALAIALVGARGSRRRQSAAVARAAIGYRPAPAAAALVGVILILVLLLSGFRHLSLAAAVVLTVISAVVLMLLAVWTVAAPLVSMGRTAHRSLADNGYGLCTGLAGAGAPAALTDWLHASIQHCAQLPLEQPLTFAMLREAGITLQMVATDLGLARPVTIPFSEEQYLFSPADLARYFPAPVVDHVLRAAGVPDAERDSELAWWLPADELPVVIGTRLSASVPLLLSSLRLYSARAEAGRPVESYIADGALTSNFPIHFFDDWIPDHPTFGLDLVTAGEGQEPGVFMATEREGVRLPPSVQIRSLGSFLSRVQDATRNWRDELQAELPGFRDRVCQIRLGPGEGGFHLDANADVVRGLVARGEQAGQEILETFDWDQHRFTRYLTLMALLRENFALIGERLADYERWPNEAQAPFALAGHDAQEHLLAVNQATVALIEQAAALPAPDAEWQGEPEPSMRIGPRV